MLPRRQGPCCACEGNGGQLAVLNQISKRHMQEKAEPIADLSHTPVDCANSGMIPISEPMAAINDLRSKGWQPVRRLPPQRLRRGNQGARAL